MNLKELLGSLKGILSPENPVNKQKQLEGNLKRAKQKKGGAPRYGGGSPVNKAASSEEMPSYMKATVKRMEPGNITKGENLYKPNKVGENSPDYSSDKVGKRGDVRQITDDTKLGGMQKIKTKKLKKVKEDRLGRSKGVPHYGTMMAKKLMGGKR